MPGIDIIIRAINETRPALAELEAQTEGVKAQLAAVSDAAYATPAEIAALLGQPLAGVEGSFREMGIPESEWYGAAATDAIAQQMSMMDDYMAREAQWMAASRDLRENFQDFDAAQAAAMENFDQFDAMQQAAANMSRFGVATDETAASVNTLAASGSSLGGHPWFALMLAGMGASLGVSIERAGMAIQDAKHYVGTIEGNQRLLDQWGAAITAMGSQVGVTPQQLWSGLYELLSLNVKPEDAMSELKTAAMASVAGKTDMFDTAKLIAGIENAYEAAGVHMKAMDVSDRVLTMAHLGGIQLRDLAQHLGQVTAWAAQLGISLNQVGAGLDVVTEKGIDPARAMTGLRDLFAQLVRHQKNFRKAGIDIVSDAEHGGLPKVLADLERLTKGNKIAMEQFIPDIRALTPLFDMLGNEGPAEYTRKLEEMQHSQGETLRQTDEMLKGASGAWKQFVPAFDNFASSFLKLFDPMTILHLLTHAFDWSAKAMDSIRERGEIRGKEIYDLTHGQWADLVKDEKHFDRLAFGMPTREGVAALIAEGVHLHTHIAIDRQGRVHTRAGSMNHEVTIEGYGTFTLPRGRQFDR